MPHHIGPERDWLVALLRKGEFSERAMGRHTQRNSPAKPYQEAFPSIEVVGVLQAWRAGQRVCEWTDEYGCVVGHTRLTGVTDKTVTFQQKFFGSPNILATNSEVSLGLASRFQNAEHDRTDFRCPARLKGVAALHHAWAEWRCRTCHDLTYLTRSLDPVSRIVRHRDELACWLAEQANKRSRQYLNKERAFGKLGREIEAAGVSDLPEQLRYRSTGRWLLPGQESMSEADQPAGVDWQLGDQTGLAWFRQTDRPISTATAASLDATGCDLIGLPLFRKPLHGLLQERVDDLRRDPTMCDMKRSARQALAVTRRVRATVSFRPLVLDSLRQLPSLGRSDDGVSELTSDLDYTGDDQLWSLFGRLQAAQGLKGILPSEGVLRLVMRFPAGREAAARHVLARRVAEIRKHIAEQASALTQLKATAKLVSQEMTSPLSRSL